MTNWVKCLFLIHRKLSLGLQHITTGHSGICLVLVLRGEYRGILRVFLVSQFS